MLTNGQFGSRSRRAESPEPEGYSDRTLNGGGMKENRHCRTASGSEGMLAFNRIQRYNPQH